MKTKTEVTKRFGGGLSQCTIPAGLRVVSAGFKDKDGKPAYWLDEFPSSVFAQGSIGLHDAIHYGVVYTSDEVTE